MDLLEQEILNTLKKLEEEGKIKREPSGNGDDKWYLVDEEAKG